MIDPHAIRAAIKAALEKKDWRQADFARALGVHRQHVSRMLDDRLPPVNFTLATLQKIAATLDIDITVSISMKTITINSDQERSVALWISKQGGVAVWTNKDVISPGRGRMRLTPVFDSDGAPTPPPNIAFGAKPDYIVTDPAAITVNHVNEFKRVKVRQSTTPRGLSRADQALVDAAKRAAGRDSTHRLDYSDPLAPAPWCMAVIETPLPPRPFNTELLKP